MRPFIALLLLAVLGSGCGKRQEAQVPGSDAREAGGVEGTLEGVGPGLAVEGFEPEGGRIKLSEKAVGRLGLTFTKAAFREGVVWIPTEALLQERGREFVYTLSADGWMRRIPVKTGPRLRGAVPVLSGLSPGTSYVEKGAPLVHLAEIDLVSGEEPE